MCVCVCRIVKELDSDIQSFTASGLQAMRALCEEAITAAGLHVTQGGKLWELFRYTHTRTQTHTDRHTQAWPNTHTHTHTHAHSPCFATSAHAIYDCNTNRASVTVYIRHKNSVYQYVHGTLLPVCDAVSYMCHAVTQRQVLAHSASDCILFATAFVTGSTRRPMPPPSPVLTQPNRQSGYARCTTDSWHYRWRVTTH